jgi:hypothetical protein
MSPENNKPMASQGQAVAAIVHPADPRHPGTDQLLVGLRRLTSGGPHAMEVQAPAAPLRLRRWSAPGNCGAKNRPRLGAGDRNRHLACPRRDPTRLPVPTKKAARSARPPLIRTSHDSSKYRYRSVFQSRITTPYSDKCRRPPEKNAQDTEPEVGDQPKKERHPV